jgi:hypothetical protein
MKTFKNKDDFKTNIIKYILIGIENNTFKVEFDYPSGNLLNLSNDYIFSCNFYEYDDHSFNIQYTFSNIADCLNLTKDEYNLIMYACYEHTYSNDIMNGLLDLIKENEDNSHFDDSLNNDDDLLKMVDLIDNKWNEYRNITNNNDAWTFKEWLKSKYDNRNDVFGLDEAKDDDLPF